MHTPQQLSNTHKRGLCVEFVCLFGSIRFDVAVDPLDEAARPRLADGAAQQEKSHGKQAHVPKVEDALQKAAHFRLPEEVVDRVEEHVNRGASRREEGNPLPVVVLRVEDEVRGDDGGAHAHHHKNAEDQHHEPVHVVKLVVPETREDEVHLDEDGAKGEDARQRDDDERGRVPGARRDGARDGVGAAREVPFPPHVPPHQSAPHHQREAHKEPNREDLDQRAQVHHVGRVVIPSHAVEARDDDADGAGQQKHGGDHGALPVGVLLVERGEELLVEAPGCVPRHRGAQSVAHDEGGHQLPALLVHLSVELPEDGKQPRGQHNDDELPPGAHRGRKQLQVGRPAEHVAVHLLPPAVLPNPVEALQVVVVARVPRVVVAQGAEQDQAHEAAEENHHHEAVED
mmetsp:Transcript_271/g.555  ORF Transcript_271/g.555 Transcript_271/m.555 type:complete len:400 (-) Transcript_271:689-1888(-)